MIAATYVQIDLDTLRLERLIRDTPQRCSYAQVVRVIAVQIVERAAQRLVPLDSEDYRRHAIDMRHHALGIDQHDTVFETLDYRLGLALLVDQLLDVELFELLKPLGHLVEFRSDGLELGEPLLAEPP